MSQPQESRLQQALADIAGKVRRFQGRNLGEQNTKASLISARTPTSSAGPTSPRTAPPCPLISWSDNVS
jgi:hypothetical protein